MKYYKQETYYTCGCACIRNVLSEQGLSDIEEKILVKKMGTNDLIGTRPEVLIEIADELNLECKSAHNGTLDELNEMRKDGWSILVAYCSGSIPHVSMFLGINNGFMKIYDPDTDRKELIVAFEFEESMWLVEGDDYINSLTENEEPTDINLNKWYVAYKKK